MAPATFVRGDRGEPSGMGVRVRAVGLLAALVLPTAAGCGSASDGDVADVARRFYDALGADDGRAACRLLAPPTRAEVESTEGRPCAEAILEEDVQQAVGAPHVEVYASMAQVRWPQETTFVARYGTGWRVLAAGCSPDPDSPPDADRYDCTVQGG